MKLYYAGKFSIMGPAEIVTQGISPSDSAGRTPLADSPEIAREAARFAISPEHRTNTPFALYTITVPDEMELERYGDNEESILYHFFAYPGTVPPEAIRFDIDTETISGEEA